MLMDYLWVSSDTDRQTTALQRVRYSLRAWIRGGCVPTRRVGRAMIARACSVIFVWLHV